MKTALKQGLILCLFLLLLCAIPFAAAAEGSCPHGADVWVWKNAKAVSCMEDGNKAGWFCPTCNRFVNDSGAFNDAAVIKAPGSHDWSAWTDAGNGKHTRKCNRATCTATESVAHVWDAGSVTKEAKCNAAGEKLFKCTVCTATKTEEIPKPAHDYVETTFPPTCTEQGYVKHTCANCGDNYKDHFVNANGHKFSEWTVTKEGNCTTGTTYTRTCSVCSTTETKSDAAPGHQYVDTVIEPKCESAGKTTHVCSVCGDTYDTDVKKPLGHHIVVDAEEAATCQKTGLTQGKHCDRVFSDGTTCGKIFVEQKIVPKKDHTIVTITPIAATCQNEGRTEGSFCSECGTVFAESEVIPKVSHNYIETIIKPATCTDSGLVRLTCSYCDDTRTKEVDKLGHDYDVIVISAATCDVDGVSKKVCKVCGAETNPEIVKAPGHKWSKKWTVDKAATCTASGVKSYHCTVCGAKNNVTTIPVAGHKYTAATTTIKAATTGKDGSVTKVCAVCGKGKTVTSVRKIGSIKLSQTQFTCDGKAKKPTVVVRDADGNKLKNGTDYKLTYSSGRKKPGTYAVKVTFIGNYSGTKKLNFKIGLAAPKTVKVAQNAKNNSTKIAFSKVVGAEKYVIYYATSPDGKYKKLTATENRSFTTTSLSLKKTYYFKVRAMYGDIKGTLSSAATASAASGKVYVPTDGTHYHKSNCGYLAGSKVLVMTAAEAKKAGKTPCSVCFG